MLYSDYPEWLKKFVSKDTFAQYKNIISDLVMQMGLSLQIKLFSYSHHNEIKNINEMRAWYCNNCIKLTYGFAEDICKNNLCNICGKEQKYIWWVSKKVLQTITCAECKTSSKSTTFYTEDCRTQADPDAPSCLTYCDVCADKRAKKLEENSKNLYYSGIKNIGWMESTPELRAQSNDDFVLKILGLEDMYILRIEKDIQNNDIKLYMLSNCWTIQMVDTLEEILEYMSEIYIIRDGKILPHNKN